ncbi:MAG TPA: OmpA family protein [Thermodesulfobacteriota bacterium]|nr:OmpA family protein [Thermodesulfobacteriota bacterium]
MFTYFKKSVLFIALTIGSTGAFMGCATSEPPPPQPPSGKIGELSKFDITTASPEEIANALQRDGRVVISGGILFETDSARLTPSAVDLVKRLADVMMRNPDLKVAVVGHTDSTGDFKYNIKLSEQRADAIVNQLVEDGVAANRLAGVGVGPLSPVATNDTVEGRAQNRRVELVLIS